MSLAPCHNDIWGNGVQLHLSCPRHMIQVSSHLHAPVALPPGKESRSPMGVPQSRSRRCTVEKKSCTAGNRTITV
jgi:hypothetical protein